MNNYNEEILKSNSLINFISNKLKEYVDKEEFERINQLSSFSNIFDEQIKESINNKKLELIPVDLIDEVNFYIDKQYNGNKEAYLSSVEKYFNTFNLELLSKCNILNSSIYEESTTKGRRKLKRERKHNLWHASVLLKLVGKKRAKYSCNSIFNEFKQNKKKEFEFIKNCKVVGTDGKVLNLSDCVKSSKQAIAEKLNLIDVQEKIAKDKDWTWCFITLTLPGEFHPNPLKGKDSYNGISPKDSARLLNDKIKNVRSLMLKRGLKAGRDYIGCSSAEAHKDGCLHKHLLIFCSLKMIEEVRKAFQFTFNNMNEDSFRVNDGRAKASSYIFKYVMKSITSYDSSINFDEISKDDENAVLNNAFRSYNFIRGFSFFGIDNCLTKFRFLARNLKQMNLPFEIESLVKENNLYELLTKGFFNMIDNIYKEGVFVGCRFNGNEFIKNFFSLVRNVLDTLKDEVKNLHTEIAKNNREVILNHNYSRKDSLSAFLEEMERLDKNFNERFIQV